MLLGWKGDVNDTEDITTPPPPPPPTPELPPLLDNVNPTGSLLNFVIVMDNNCGNFVISGDEVVEFSSMSLLVS